MIKNISPYLFLNSIFLSHAQIDPEAILTSMSLREKIAQCLIVAAASHFEQPTELLASMLQKCSYNLNKIYVSDLIKNYAVGGIIFLFKSDPFTQIKLAKEYQSLSKIPLLFAQDNEWGLAMRLDLDPAQVIRYPRNLTLGAIADLGLIYKIGREIGKQCAAIGIHMNLAPVADVNNNYLNPVIHDRSFGDDPQRVALLAREFNKGLQAAGVLSCAKHFPGHGDTSVDSHIDLPIINHTRDHLNRVELAPFKSLIKANINAIMPAHLIIPSLDNSNTPASLSYKIVTDLLQKELGFTGLIITDGLGMEGVSKHYAPGELELAAFLAGNDLLLCPLDVPSAINQIEQIIKTGKVSEQELDRRVLKILRAKQKVLNTQDNYKLDTQTKIKEFLVRPKAQDLQTQAYRAAITLVPTSKPIIFNNDNFVNSALIQIGSLTQDYFNLSCKQNNKSVLKYPKSLENHDLQLILEQTKSSSQVIIAISELNKFASQDFGVHQNTRQLIADLQSANKQIVIILFGTPYAAKMFKDYGASIIVAYEDVVATQAAVLDVLTGQLIPTGTLPIKTA